jgi:hypothetical protein
MIYRLSRHPECRGPCWWSMRQNLSWDGKSKASVAVSATIKLDGTGGESMGLD